MLAIDFAISIIKIIITTGYLMIVLMVTSVTGFDISILIFTMTTSYVMFVLFATSNLIFIILVASKQMLIGINGCGNLLFLISAYA